MKTKNYNQFLKSLILGLVLFGVACTEMQAGEFYSKSSNIEKVLSDTLIIPFGTDWGGGGSGHPVPVYCPDFAQTCDKIIVLSSYQMTIPYIIYKEGETTPTAQGNISVIPPCSDVISISQWEEGNYTIYITLAGRVFYGTFSIE